MVGSIYERKTRLPLGLPLMAEESRFTDDSVFTMAVAEALLSKTPVGSSFRSWAKRYPEVGASKRFTAWLQSGSDAPYGGDTNGCLMRVSPAVFMASSQTQALQQANAVTMVTHDSPVAIQAVRSYATVLWRVLDGARSTEAMAVFKQEGVPLRKVAAIHEAAQFRMRADHTLEDVYACLAESHTFESAMLQCFHCGGDVDTLCAVIGPIAEALWGIPPEMANWALARMPVDMRATLRAEYQAVERLAHMPWHQQATRLLAA
jgi:ADP-ribosylglycohydrolase